MKPVNSKTNSMFSGPTSNSVGDGGGPSAADLEVRPGGMMVQKRDTNQCSQPVPTIRVRVKYGSSYHEIRISSQASFGNKNSGYLFSSYEQVFGFRFQMFDSY